MVAGSYCGIGELNAASALIGVTEIADCLIEGAITGLDRFEFVDGHLGPLLKNGKSCDRPIEMDRSIEELTVGALGQSLRALAEVSEDATHGEFGVDLVNLCNEWDLPERYPRKCRARFAINVERVILNLDWP